MKTIKYFYTFLLIPLFLLLSCTGNPDSRTSIVVKPDDNSISPEILQRASEIISGRLNDFAGEQPVISVVRGTKQIKATFADDLDPNTVEDLLTHKGIVEFYETFDRDQLTQVLDGDTGLFAMLKRSEVDNAGAKIGCASGSKAGKISEYLKTLGTGGKCRFTWSQNLDSSDVCLYALKLGEGEGPAITNNEIESSKFGSDRIMIKLKPSAAGLWAVVTARNIGKPIALVLDNNVIAAPKVLDPIESGEIEISGRFTRAEAGYISSMLNNGVLPVDFIVVR